MDFLNGVAAQTRGLFESMSPGSRLLAGLLMAVAAISAATVYQNGSVRQEEVLISGEYLPDSHLIRIEAAIAQAGLSGHRREGKQILVPAEQKSAFLAAVADADALPPNFNTLLEQSLEQGNPLESREATRERLKIARQQTLSEIVRAMHWVEDAIVLYDERESTGLSGKRQVTCSVNVRPKPGEVLDARRTEVLQTLVAHAVIGLRPEDIAVTDLGESAVSDEAGTVSTAPVEPVSFTQSESEEIQTPPATDSPSVQLKAWASEYQDVLVVLGIAISGLALLWLVVPTREAREESDQRSEVRGQAMQEVFTERVSPAAAPGKFQFDDLSKLDDATLAALIDEVEPEVMALALAGSNDALLDRLMDQLPRDVARTFRDQLLQLGPTRLSDVEAAQRAVAAAATQLDSQLQPSHQAA